MINRMKENMQLHACPPKSGLSSSLDPASFYGDTGLFPRIPVGSLGKLQDEYFITLG